MSDRKRKSYASNRMVRCHYCPRDAPEVRYSNLARHTTNNHGPEQTHPPRIAGVQSVFDFFSTKAAKKPKLNPVPTPQPPEPTPPLDDDPTSGLASVLFFQIF